MRLKDKVAIITGGGRGIGKAIALAFAKEGASVVIASRTLSELQQTAKEIQAFGYPILAVQTDVSNRNDVENLVRQTVEKFGTADILVTDAAVQCPIGSLVTNDPDDWIQAININLIGTFLCMKAVLPLMVEKRSGKIITLSGGGATSPRPCFTAYAASKAAVVRLTETLAEEVKEFNIQVNAIAPGPVNTKMLDDILQAGEKAGREFTEAQKRAEKGGVSPEQAATLALFLASSESDGITGKLISAVWDDWKNPLFRTDKDFATLRRIDGKNFFRR